jgi:hypothetical protein
MTGWSASRTCFNNSTPNHPVIAGSLRPGYLTASPVYRITNGHVCRFFPSFSGLSST